MPAGVLYDGDYATAPTPVGAVVPEFLVETNSRLFRQRYHWTAEAFNKVANRENFDSKGPKGTPMEGCPLVGTSAATDLGVGGLVEFTRTFAEVPKVRRVRELYPNNYQFLQGGDIASETITVPSLVEFQYFPTASPESIPLRLPLRLYKLGGLIYIVGGTLSDFLNDTNHLAEAETADRWMGNIFFKKTRTVPSLTSVLT